MELQTFFFAILLLYLFSVDRIQSFTTNLGERVALHRGEPPQADYPVQGAWRKIEALLLRNNLALLFSADKNKSLPIFLVSACFHNFINEVSTLVNRERAALHP